MNTNVLNTKLYLVHSPLLMKPHAELLCQRNRKNYPSHSSVRSQINMYIINSSWDSSHLTLTNDAISLHVPFMFLHVPTMFPPRSQKKLRKTLYIALSCRLSQYKSPSRIHKANNHQPFPVLVRHSYEDCHIRN